MFEDQYQRIRVGRGFIAALDQSGGSTPKALQAYGVSADSYSTPEEMFARVHEFRTRIVESPSFDERVIGAILFEDTMRRSIDSMPTVEYLWERKGVVPFVKVDKGLGATAEGVQTLADMPHLEQLLVEARELGAFGTKARSVVHDANAEGISRVVAQQFEVAEQVLQANLVPIVEPEVSIDSETKGQAEDLLLEALLGALESVSAPVILKLTLPDRPNQYRQLVEHPRVLRVVALSGGYSLQESVDRLAANNGVIASFSRAFADGLLVSQTNAEFNERLDANIRRIVDASST